MTLKSENKSRIIEFDILRVLACFMVVAMHAPMPSQQANGIFLSSLSYSTAPCIGLFFMISGAMLLPVGETKVFFRKRLSKVLLPTVFWSLFYICLQEINQGFSLTSFLYHCCSIPFIPQGNGVLWFMYTLMGLYLISPIISRWIEHSSKREIEFYLVLWVISLCYPILGIFLDVSQSNTSIIYYFSGYLGYYILGYYMKHYSQNISMLWVVMACLISLVAPIVCKLLNWTVDFYSLFWYLSLFVTIQCIGWYKLIVDVIGWKIGKRIRNVIVKFSNLSFGIYFVHIFIMRSLIWKWEWIGDIQSYIVQTITVFLLTILLSFVSCLFISYLPKADYIIGYRH